MSYLLGETSSLQDYEMAIVQNFSAKEVKSVVQSGPIRPFTFQNDKKLEIRSFDIIFNIAAVWLILVMGLADYRGIADRHSWQVKSI